MFHKTFVITCAIAIYLSSFAIAENKLPVSALDQAAIAAYYDTARTAHEQPYESYESFMNQTVSKDLKITLDLTNHFPGQPPARQTVELDKEKMMASLAEDYKSLQTASISHRLLSVKIAADGKSATAKDLTMISNITSDLSGQKFEVESQSTCTDTLILNEGIIQMSSSSCKAETYLYPAK